MKRLKVLLYALAAAALALSMASAGCGSSKKDGESSQSIEQLLAKEIRPNEMGQVMVIEYHRIDEKEGDYQRSIENFRKDLDNLYQKGYRLITFHDLMSGRIGVPAGTTPIVISFDDSTEGQFRYLKEGEKTVIDPNCAMGMMNEFYKTHKDFGYTALFNYLPELFDQEKYKKEKVDYLVNNGFEFGDHTTSHPKLNKLTDEQVQQEIAEPVKDLKGLNPQAKVDILCLPHGIEPTNQDLMFNGQSGGTTYKMNWALLVGSNPFYPPYHYKNPGQIVPRVQVIDYDPEDGSGADGSGYWLRWFDKHPESRFISDGDPTTICAPAYMESRLLPDKLPSGVRFVGYEVSAK